MEPATTEATTTKERTRKVKGSETAIPTENLVNKEPIPVWNGRKQITPEIIAILQKPLPAEAVTQNPAKKYLSNIKGVYITERLNEAFGIGSWTTEHTIIENDPAKPMVVIFTTLCIPDYGIRMCAYGGNDNPDRGDAYKGAVTDAMSKIASYLDIAKEVFKGKHESQPGNKPADPNAPQKPVPPTAAPNTNGNSTAPAPGGAPAKPSMSEAQLDNFIERVKAGKEDNQALYNKTIGHFSIKPAFVVKMKEALKEQGITIE